MKNGVAPVLILSSMAAGARAVWLSRDGRAWRGARAEPTSIARDLLEAAMLERD